MSLRTHSINGHVESKSEEQHPRKFKGTFADVKLHDLVENGTVTPTAAWLLMVIDSLASSERGCWASNAFLAKKIHKSERTIPRLLQSLEKAKLLVSSWCGCERRLWIDWGRESKDTREKSYEKSRRHDKNDMSRHVKNDMSKMTCIERSSTKGDTIVSPVTKKRGETPPKPARADGENLGFKKAAKYLREKLRENHLQPSGSSRATWEEAFRLLEEEDSIPSREWKAVLVWYCKHLPPEKEKALLQRTGRSKLPSSRNGKQFRSLFGWYQEIKRADDLHQEEFLQSKYHDED